MFYRKWKIRNFVVLDVQSAAHLEVFLIKQDMLFFACHQSFRHVQRHECVIAHVICRSLLCDGFCRKCAKPFHKCISFRKVNPSSKYNLLNILGHVQQTTIGIIWYLHTSSNVSKFWINRLHIFNLSQTSLQMFISAGEFYKFCLNYLK